MKKWLKIGILLLFILLLPAVVISCKKSDWDKMKIDADGGNLAAIWGSSSSDVFVVSGSGTIWHYEGSSWSPMESGTTKPLMGIWGTSYSDVFAVGSDGIILHYDGISWNDMESGSQEFFTNVWCSSPSDVFATNPNDGVFHYDGISWSAIEIDIFGSYEAVWGTSSSDVFVVGHGSTGDELNASILHYDGNSWNQMESNTPKSYELTDIWGSSPSDVFAVGSGGNITHFDGTAWTRMKSGTNDYIASVWGNSSSNVFAAAGGDIILQYDKRANMNLRDVIQVFFISAAPITELRLAIPLAMTTYHIAWYFAFLICCLGNLLPVPFLLLFLGPMAGLMSKINLFDRTITWFFKYTRHRGGLVEKYGWVGLIMFVAVPLPSTGAWTGSILAFLFGIKFKPAFLSILCGILIAGGIVTTLSYLGISFFGSLPE